MQIIKKTPSFVKTSLKFLAEPRGRTGLRRDIPLLAWNLYAGMAKIPWASNGLAGDLPSKSEFSDLSGLADFFKEHLLENLLPFWRKHSIDSSFGGYITHLDQTGCVYDETTKYAAMQARLIYAFSIGSHWQPGNGYEQVAKHGFDFLVNHFWDQRLGGWCKSVWRDGRVKDSGKHLFDQAYVLIGLAVYYEATRDPIARDYIRRTEHLLEQHAWDARHLGYYEACYTDWGLQSRHKTICIQVDMLRAFLALHQAIGDVQYQQRAIELAELIVGRMIDPVYGCVLETFYPNWCYSPMVTRDQVQIGHNLKVAWLLLQVDRIVSRSEFRLAAQRMVNFCLQYGWDSVYGGFFHDVFRSGRLASPVKIWWPECEGLHALLALHQATGEPRYLHYLFALTDFVSRTFMDREHPEWFTSCHPNGSPLVEHKGGTYKSAYHTVQACDAIVRAIQQ